ncbi:MAG: hypothetical protein V4674_02910 [Patescibacteria group bacterium]
MADTIINTPPQTPREDATGGWAVAVIVLLGVVGGFIWYTYYRTPAKPGTTNINVTLPTGGAKSQ